MNPELLLVAWCLCTSSGWFKCLDDTPSQHTQYADFVLPPVWLGVVQAPRTSSNLQEPHHHRASKELARCVGYVGTRAGWFKHIEPHRTYTSLTITELARCVGCFCSRSGWFKHSKPTRTTPSQCSRCVGHSFGVVEAQRTSSNLQETHHHSTVCRVLLHYFGVVQAPRTSSNLQEPHHHRASKELARCVGYVGTRAGWFKHIEPHRTYTSLTITELARCVGCFCSRSGWFKHSKPTRTTPSQCSRCVGHSFGVVEAQRTSSNLQETHHHSTVCRVLLHYFGVVQAPRTYTNHTILTSTELARCEGCFGTRAGWFKHSEPHRTYTNHTSTEVARCVGCLH